MTERLHLPNVTIWTCCWSAEPERLVKHLRVLRYCQSIMDCKRFILFASTYTPTPSGIELIRITVGPGFNWNIFVNREVPKFITDSFAMSVHEDGFPIRPDLWSDDFLKYDYIGAPWPDDVVGNGGFNIESQKLLQEKPFVPVGKRDSVPSDVWVCRIHRARFERKGIGFAPVDVAARFALEYATPTRPETLNSFGFHGRKDNPKAYAEGWRLIDQSEKPYAEWPEIKSVSPLKIAVVYVYAPLGGAKTENYTRRFLESYRANLPGLGHDTIIVVNGVPANNPIRKLFDSMPNCRFIEHDNSGWDIGGYQHAARDFPCDMMVFFSASTFFTRPGWLRRMQSAFLRHGDAQYGAMGNRGDLPVGVWPHIRTTAFWMAPILMNSYPRTIRTREERHPFEHGRNCFTEWVAKQGLKSWVVTWEKELLWDDWDSDPNGYSRGDQSNLLAGDRMCESPYYPPERRPAPLPAPAPVPLPPPPKLVYRPGPTRIIDPQPVARSHGLSAGQPYRPRFW